jgi:hypothetical protein
MAVSAVPELWRTELVIEKGAHSRNLVRVWTVGTLRVGRSGAFILLMNAKGAAIQAVGTRGSLGDGNAEGWRVGECTH